VLYLAGGTTLVVAGTAITAAQAATLVFTPAANFNGDVTVPFTVTDNDGLTSSAANEVITVISVNDPPPIVTITDEDGTLTPADNSVVEATGATITGSISITAVVGVASLTVAGQDITNASTAPVVIAGTEGTLTITTYDVATGAVTYSYVEDGNAENHSGGPNSITDVFAVVVTDTEGDVVTDNLDIQIIDTAPIAENDSNSVDESADASDQIATGNVLTGDSDTGAGADAIGADANATPIAAFNGATTYGTLELDADGSYSYQLSSTNIAVTELQNGQSLTDSYTYTITDGDGSTATATLSIVINGADGAPILHGTCMLGDTRSPDLIALDPNEIVTVAGSGTVTVTGGGGANDRLSIDFSEHTSTTMGDSTIGTSAAFSATTFGNVSHTGFEHFTINAANGVATIKTGDGDDIITNTGGLNGANTLDVGAGNNTITTGGGVNLIDFTSGNNTVNTGDGANTITGTSGHNYIKTGAGVETITLGGGDNIIKSGDGAGTIVAGDGENFVCSGAGADTITLGDGNNVVLAGDGANTVIVGNGVNFVIGGLGLDTLTAGDGGNYIDGGPAGANTIVSGSGNDTIFGGRASDTISAGAGNDRIHILGGGPNTVKGEGGSDTLIVDFSDATAAITNAALAVVAPVNGYDGTIAGHGSTTYTSIETFDITTGMGADIIFTGDGDDILFGGAGVDNLSAGAGNDLLTGGEGSDTLTGGSGSDTFVFTSADGNGSTDIIKDFDMSDVSTGGDVLNFADFLQVEESDPLEDFLNVTFDNATGASTITANADGEGNATDLTVVLEGVDLTQGVDSGGAGVDQAALLQSLIDSNHLIVDSM
jgi:VCBS repeat-containing protein